LEINLLGRSFTWLNNQDKLILSHIDRIFCSTDFDGPFPLTTTTALPRNPSDHVSILWKSGMGQNQRKPRFKFEKWWFQHNSFRVVVKKIWKAPMDEASAIDKCQNRVRLFRRRAKGWSMNAKAEIRRKNERFYVEFNQLDISSKSRTLSDKERDSMKFLSKELNKIWGMEETKAMQRAMEREIKGEDRNTSYFHVVANQRRRKTTIHSLDGPEGTTESTEEIVKVATNFYKDLFKYEFRPNIHLDNELFVEGEKVGSEENEALEARFSEEEIRKVVFESYSDGAPGPDGLSFMFY
jgi:hypothetical protein